MYLLGYIPAHNRLYLGDRELTIVSFSLQLAVLEYQTAIMRQDFSTADSILPRVPADQRTRVAHFLEKQGFMKQALVVSTDSDHRWEGGDVHFSGERGDMWTFSAAAGLTWHYS